MRFSVATMKQYLVGIAKRLVATMLATAAVVGVSALTMHQSPQKSLAFSLKSIQTDQATSFYADANRGQNRAWFVEMVLPGTGESKAATENLKSVAAAL
jgi:hypothetical protein